MAALGADARAARLRAPLLRALWILVAIETLGGLLLFVARLAWGIHPGVTLHVIGGVLLVPVYALYQWGHWMRVLPLRRRIDHVLGILAALSMALTLATGLLLGVPWWREGARPGGPRYPEALSALHNVGTMLVLAFVGAHLLLILARDRARTP